MIGMRFEPGKGADSSIISRSNGNEVSEATAGTSQPFVSKATITTKRIFKFPAIFTQMSQKRRGRYGGPSEDRQ
jgi:hypothetical protein